MENDVKINTSQSSDLITFTVLIDGEAIPSTIQVLKFSVKKEINRLSQAQLVIIDGDAAKGEFSVSNEDYLIPGKKIELKAGYHSDETTIFTGIVIKQSIKIRQNSTYLVIECRDEAVKLTVGRKNRYYYDSKDSDIIEEIINKYGIANEVEATNYQHSELVQYDCSDWDFIITRAQANGKICFVDEGKIHVKAPNYSAESIQTVLFGSTILDFDAEMDARSQLLKVSAYTWDEAEQEIIETEANGPDVNLNGDLTSEDLAKVIDLDNYELRHGGTLKEQVIQDWANATQLYHQLAKIRGRVRFQGIPEVKPDTVLNLQGISERFNGPIYISGVLHSIESGNWTVDAQFGLNPEWFSETFEINSFPAAGLIPAVKGLQYGKVTQLEDDPEGEDRILVTFPIVNQDEQGIWCRLGTLDAGNNRGSIFRPDVGDEVIVGFVNEDPNEGIILGQLHSSASPSPIPAEDDNNIKGFVTRSEIKFLFDDDKKIASLEMPSGKKIVLDDDSGEIHIEDENGNTLILDKSGIVMESGKDISIKAKGDIALEGVNIELKSNAQIKAEGSAGLELKSNAVTVLKGSIVQIN
ncbi:MAG: type VI secretion system tip protein VgrG [Flavobacteriia bacterium]|nr:type VI secretion system tip protein VgrG [Flavobacteriia bacterium]OJX37514.1 MAG: type IV secretion protein Rhs [Flavobacteriia bacterium 40-80]